MQTIYSHGRFQVFNASQVQFSLGLNEPQLRYRVNGALQTSGYPGSLRNPLDIYTAPAPGGLGLGENSAVIQYGGASGPRDLTLPVALDLKEKDCVQLYVARASNTQFWWIFLCNGQPVAGSFDSG